MDETILSHFGQIGKTIYSSLVDPYAIARNSGEVMVADFGIAKAASKSTETRARPLKGKILHMSPEQEGTPWTETEIQNSRVASRKRW